MMTTATSGIRAVIDAMSRDSHVSDEPMRAAYALLALYGSRYLNTLHAAIEEMLADESWSQDREPYEWLEEVRAAL